MSRRQTPQDPSGQSEEWRDAATWPAWQSFSPDGHTLATAAADRLGKLWDLRGLSGR